MTALSGETTSIDRCRGASATTWSWKLGGSQVWKTREGVHLVSRRRTAAKYWGRTSAHVACMRGLAKPEFGGAYFVTTQDGECVPRY